MSLQDRYDFEYLVNEAEKMVIDELDHQLDMNKDKTICVCQDCVLDMAAFALNTLKPAYRVSLLGKLYAGSMKDTDYGKEVEKAVSTAIEKISSNPAHD